MEPIEDQNDDHPYLLIALPELGHHLFAFVLRHGHDEL